MINIRQYLRNVYDFNQLTKAFTVIEQALSAKPWSSRTTTATSETMLQSDRFVVIDTSGSAIYYDLLDAYAWDGQELVFKRDGANTAFIRAFTGQTIDGAANTTLTTDKQVVRLISSGGEVLIV